MQEMRERLWVAALMTGATFTAEESVVLEFLALCQPSLDPDNYQAVEDAITALSAARQQVGRDALARCQMVLIKATAMEAERE